jgi:hypothetical protein
VQVLKLGNASIVREYSTVGCAHPTVPFVAVMVPVSAQHDDPPHTRKSFMTLVVPKVIRQKSFDLRRAFPHQV